jgi:hypothetical protein
MNPRREAAGIECPIGLYEKYEGEIARLTEAINHSPTAPEKILAAQDLRECVAALLDCAAYDEDDLNCRLCRNVATLRDKTASVIEKAGALAH